jgi:hypothetical protein
VVSICCRVALLFLSNEEVVHDERPKLHQPVKKEWRKREKNI